MDDVDDVAQSRLTRRRLLQASVATGVGAAAWAAPEIKALGFKPAYASTCSLTGVVTTVVTDPVRVGCRVPQAPHVRLQGPGASGEVAVGGLGALTPTPADDADGVSNTWVATSTTVEMRVRQVIITDAFGVDRPWPVDQQQHLPSIGFGNYCPASSGNAYYRLVVDTVPIGTCFPIDAD